MSFTGQQRSVVDDAQTDRLSFIYLADGMSTLQLGKGETRQQE